MTARIALRKAGLLPALDEGVEAKLVKAELENIKIRKGSPVTQEDVIAAFDRGDEVSYTPFMRQRGVYM